MSRKKDEKTKRIVLIVIASILLLFEIILFYVNRMAPELYLGGKGSFKSDVFSFACLAIEVLTGKEWYKHITPRLQSKADVSTKMMIISFSFNRHV